VRRWNHKSTQNLFHNCDKDEKGEGPWCSFDFDLMRMKRTLNALKTYFHFVTSNENDDKRNLVSFCFTFGEYKNETKSA
jgi:hypothetical protein